MAKSPSFFGLRRGSTKSLTFQVLNGRQVTKDRVYDVKNPRTFSQMQQRMVMATAAAAYAGMREIVDHSFEGYTYGQPTMSEFIRLNAKMLRDALLQGLNGISFNPYKNRNALPNPYIVSKGSLNNPNLVYVDETNDSVVNARWLYKTIDYAADEILEDFCKKNAIGDYITILCLAYSPESNLSQFGYIRLTPKAEEMGTIIVNESVLTDFFDIESNIPVNLENNMNSSWVPISFDFDQGGILGASSACIISTKKIQWKRSSSEMFPYWDTTPMYSADTALATYPVGTDYILNGGTV